MNLELERAKAWEQEYKLGLEAADERIKILRRMVECAEKIFKIVNRCRLYGPADSAYDNMDRYHRLAKDVLSCDVPTETLNEYFDSLFGGLK